VAYTYSNYRQRYKNDSDDCGLKSVGDDHTTAGSVNSQLHRRVVVITLVCLQYVVVDTRCRGVDVTAAERHAVRVKVSVFQIPVDRPPHR